MIRTFVILLFLPTVAAAQQPLPKAPPGFQVEIVLQTPDIEAPTALCVAPNGDVYYAEDPMDMRGPPTKNIDKIWMLKGGDPKKKILIADQMWAVMGLEIIGDKLYVVHAPHVTAFTLDAEGKPRERKELFDDLGPKVAGLPGFNDHIPSGIRMGMDGWLYVSIGDKGIPQMTRKEPGSVEVAEGRERRGKKGNHISLEGGGVIRFRPDGSGLEVFASGTRNHLDVPLDEHDRVFVRDNTDDGRGWWTRLMYLPRGAFLGYPWAYTRHPKEVLPMVRDFGGGSPCGGFVYCDDGLPETYRGRIFHCEWGKGMVSAVKVAPNGGGFQFVDEIKFLDPAGTSYKNFRPFTLRPTADGRGFYVTDWGYSGWSNKTQAGRLLKVTYTGNDVKPTPRGKDTDPIEDLIKALDHPAHSERLRAQRVLISKGKEAGIALEKAIAGDKLHAAGLRHAPWVLTATGTANADTALKLMANPDAAVRLEAVRAFANPFDASGNMQPKRLSKRPGESNEEYNSRIVKRDNLYAKKWAALIEKWVKTLNGLLEKDPDPQVRMHAAQALGTINELQQGMIHDAVTIGAFHELDRFPEYMAKETDRYVRFALVGVIKRSNHQQIETFEKLLSRSDTDSLAALELYLLALTDQYDVAATSVLSKLTRHPNESIRQQAVAALARSYFDRKPYAGGWWGTQPAAQKPPIRNVSWEGTPAVREAMLKALADKDAGVRKMAILGLLDANDAATFEPLVQQYGKESDAETRADLLCAIAGLSSPRTADFLKNILLDATNPEALRVEAIVGLEKSKNPAAAEAIAKTVAAGASETLQVRALEALGALKAKQLLAVGETAVKSPSANVRQAAALALAKLGDPQTAAVLLPLLNDKNTMARIAAIQALGTLHAKMAIPAILQTANEPATQFEAIKALAQMPDPRALTAYLTGLGSKSPELRTACRQAVAAIREPAVPILEQLVKRNEVRPEIIAELRAIYSSFTPILDWRIIGPFPNDGKSYPPEKEQNLDAAYKSADGKEVKWRPMKGDANNHGRINLNHLPGSHQDVVAYAYVEIDSPTERDAEFLAGSDDSIVIWLNDKKVHQHLADRGWSFNSDKVKARLQKGKNRLLIQCGNHGGGWDFSVAVSGAVDRYAFLKGGAQKFNLDDFRAFARKNKGDAVRGAKLFMDLKGVACVKCHAVGGVGGQVGPDLAGVGLKYQRDDLATSVLEPSKIIAQGYETIVVATKQGQVLTGVFKGETGDAVTLADAEGKKHAIAKKDIDEKSFSPVSIMPNGLNDGMTLQDFADLIAYLEARREEKK